MAIRPEDRVLDRRPPSTYAHVEKYPAHAIRRLAVAPRHVEKQLTLPKRYQVFMDQLDEGACVGFGESILMSLLNRKLYDAWWLYREAQLVDEWPETPPEEGTSLSAGFDVLRRVGHRELRAGTSKPPKIHHGIVDVNRWILTVDEGRAAAATGTPMCDGIAWFSAFYKPVARRVRRNGRERVEYWIPEPEHWGRHVGYHCITRSGASDEREAFSWLNSWGMSYPWPVWISYRSHERLMRRDMFGESAVVTDR